MHRYGITGAVDSIRISNRIEGDGPSILPQYPPYIGGWSSAQIPAEWLASDDKETFNETFVVNKAFASHVTGGKVSLASDQMNAVPVTERQSGLASSSLANLPMDLQENLLSTFLTMNGEGENFLGYNEYNHIGSDSYGPLKSNMTKLCPQEYTIEEKDEQCYSMQESVWGVELTAKLENIKYAVDPDLLFKCYGCIYPKSSGSSNDVPSVPVDPPVETPTFSNDDEVLVNGSPAALAATATTATTILSTTIPGAEVDPKAAEESSSSSSRQYYTSTFFIAIAFIVGVWMFV